ncbi:helix-turn-helix domain-containing protein [Pseudomonas putida]
MTTTARTAEDVIQSLKQLPLPQRQRFFMLLSENIFQDQDTHTHEEVFGHLYEAGLTSAEAADFLEVSASTFRRYLARNLLTPTSTVGRNLMFAADELKAFKKALKATKG